MGARYVRFGDVYVNPWRVLSVTDVYSQAEINVGASSPIKTGMRTREVIKLLEDAMGGEPDANQRAPGLSERDRKDLLADVVRYLEGKLTEKAMRET